MRNVNINQRRDERPNPNSSLLEDGLNNLNYVMNFDTDWKKFIGDNEYTENIDISQNSCIRDIQKRSIKVILKMKEASSPDDFSIPPFELRRKINEGLMMSVGRLIVFDIMQSESLAAAQKVIQTN